MVVYRLELKLFPVREIELSSRMPTGRIPRAMRTLLLVLPLVVQGGLIPSRPLHRRTQQPLLAAQQPAPKKGSASEWESARSDSTISNSSSMPLDGMASPPINGWYDSLHQQEYRLLRLIQRTPGLMPISLAVHYSLLPKVITPLLSLMPIRTLPLLPLPLLVL